MPPSSSRNGDRAIPFGEKEVTIDQPWRADVIFCVAMIAFASRRMRAEIVAMLALLAAMLAGVVAPGKAFTGFASPAVAIAAFIMVLGVAVRGSGALDIVLRRAVSVVRLPPARGPVLGLVAAVAAAGIGPAAAFAGLLPAATALARRSGRSNMGYAPGSLLLGLLFSCGLGGLVTITATLPALIVAQIRADMLGGQLTWGAFALTRAGGPLALLGLMLLGLIFAVARLVWGGPVEARHTPDAPAAAEGYTSEVLVPPGSMLAGRSIRALEAETGQSARVVAIIREDYRRIAPRPAWLIEQADIVVLACEPDTLQRLMEQYDLRLAGDRVLPRAGRLAVVEAVVTPASELVGQTPLAIEFARRHRFSLLAIGRSGAQPTIRLARITLRAGDVLVLQGVSDDLPERLSAIGCLPLAERRLRFGRQRLVAAPVVLLLAALILAGAGIEALPIALLAATLALLASGAMTVDEAYAGIAWPRLFTVAALLPLIGAMHRGGIEPQLVNGLVASLHGVAGWIAVARVLALALLVAGAIGAIPAALLLAPLAVEVGARLGAADPLLIAVALGTAAWMTPWAEARESILRAGMRFAVTLRLAVPLVILLLVAGPPLILWLAPWPVPPP